MCDFLERGRCVTRKKRREYTRGVVLVALDGQKRGENTQEEERV